MKKKYNVNHSRAWAWFVYNGDIPVDAKPNSFVLHHKDPSLKKNDPERYHEWRVEDLVPMTRSSHMSLHASLMHADPLSQVGSDEWKAKISNTLKGHTVSDETRRKISETQKGRPNHKTAEGLKEYYKTHKPWNYGKPQSAETIEKLRLASLGRKASDETKRKMSATHQKRYTDQAARDKVSKQFSALIWVNDGAHNKRVDPTKITDGFVPGRLKFLRKKVSNFNN